MNDEDLRCQICGAPMDVHLMSGDPCVLIGDGDDAPESAEAMFRRVMEHEPAAPKDTLGRACATTREATP